MDEIVSKLKKNNDDLYKEKNEYQCQIRQLQSDLKEAVDRIPDDNFIIHCGSAIAVAQELIDKASSYKNIIGRDSEVYRYSKSELKQIAEHLLVYVNNVEDRD